MSANLLSIVNELAAVKQLDKSRLTEIIEDCLYQAIAKKLQPENELEIISDLHTNRLFARFKRIVVESDLDFGEISLQAAQEIDPDLKLGDYIEVEMGIADFEPKVIKNARRAIQERIKLLEEERIMFDYEKQQQQIVSGRITKAEYNGYTVDIGYAEAILPSEEQVEDEYYRVGDIIKGYVINVRKRKTDVVVVLSRSHPEFVKKLFEMEIPEIIAGEIEIKKIVREPGLRTKVAVESQRPGVDAAGGCLGPKGLRLEQIRKELHGEQIDVVVWDERPEQLIANAIGEDLVEQVYSAERGKFARVIVKPENKNLAIGKKGKNVKLAAKLTGFKIDIYTQDEFEEKISEERRITSHITDLDGVTPKAADALRNAGYTSVQDVFAAGLEELSSIDGITAKLAAKLKEAAARF